MQAHTTVQQDYDTYHVCDTRSYRIIIVGKKKLKKTVEAKGSHTNSSNCSTSNFSRTGLSGRILSSKHELGHKIRRMHANLKENGILGRSSSIGIIL